MTKRLLIMRHGEAAPGYPDSERILTARGHVEAERMGGWSKAQALENVRLYVSPYVRARQTAAHLAVALGCEPQVLPIITPDDSPQAVCDWLLTEEESGNIVLVSHMPLVGALTGLLVEGRIERGVMFPTAAVAELKAELWAAGCARLARFTTPADVA